MVARTRRRRTFHERPRGDLDLAVALLLGFERHEDAADVPALFVRNEHLAVARRAWGGGEGSGGAREGAAASDEVWGFRRSSLDARRRDRRFSGETSLLRRETSRSMRRGVRFDAALDALRALWPACRWRHVARATTDRRQIIVDVVLV